MRGAENGAKCVYNLWAETSDRLKRILITEQKVIGMEQAAWNHGISPEANGYSEKNSYFYRAMHFSAKRGIAIACRLSVRPSVCLSVCL